MHCSHADHTGAKMKSTAQRDRQQETSLSLSRSRGGGLLLLALLATTPLHQEALHLVPWAFASTARFPTLLHTTTGDSMSSCDSTIFRPDFRHWHWQRVVANLCRFRD